VWDLAKSLFCRYGAKCYRPGCTVQHPKDASRILSIQAALNWWTSLLADLEFDKETQQQQHHQQLQQMLCGQWEPMVQSDGHIHPTPETDDLGLGLANSDDNDDSDDSHLNPPWPKKKPKEHFFLSPHGKVMRKSGTRTVGIVTSKPRTASKGVNTEDKPRSECTAHLGSVDTGRILGIEEHRAPEERHTKDAQEQAQEQAARKKCIITKVADANWKSCEPERTQKGL